MYRTTKTSSWARKFTSAAVVLGLLQVAGPANAEVSPALLEIRRQFTDSTFNSLTFRHMDEIFYSYNVDAGSGEWKLPYDPVPLLVQYDFEGQTYTTDDFLDRTYTNAMLVIRDGKIVYENYRNLSTNKTRFLSMSMAKSFTSILVGAAVADGKIRSVDDQVVVYLPELEGTAYDGPTIRHLLLMRSGADRNDSYAISDRSSPAGITRELGMVQGTRRYRDEALTTMTRRTEPGTTYNYSTLETIVLGWVVERATGEPIQDYMSTRLWKPLGAEANGYWIADGPPGVGDAIAGMGFNARLRDYGRLGLMMLQNGFANGRQIIPASWVRESTVPGPGEEPTVESRTTGYRYQWWTFTDSDAYAAVGLQGQYIYIDPQTNTVVVKLSYFPIGDQQPGQETEAFLRALSTSFSGS